MQKIIWFGIGFVICFVLYLILSGPKEGLPPRWGPTLWLHFDQPSNHFFPRRVHIHHWVLHMVLFIILCLYVYSTNFHVSHNLSITPLISFLFGVAVAGMIHGLSYRDWASFK